MQLARRAERQYERLFFFVDGRKQQTKQRIGGFISYFLEGRHITHAFGKASWEQRSVFFGWLDCRSVGSQHGKVQFVCIALQPGVRLVEASS